MRRRDEGLALEIEDIRRALGAVALAEPAVFWVYRREGQWWTRREGSASEQRFASPEDARAHAKLLAARCRSWRLFMQDERGGFTEEHEGWPGAMRRLLDEDGTPTDLA